VRCAPGNQAVGLRANLYGQYTGWRKINVSNIRIRYAAE